MVFSFLIPSSNTSEEPSMSNNSLCCSSDTSSAVQQQQKTITPQPYSHCTDACKTPPNYFSTSASQLSSVFSLSLCKFTQEWYCNPTHRFLFWGDSLDGFLEATGPSFVLVKTVFSEVLSPNDAICSHKHALALWSYIEERCTR